MEAGHRRLAGIPLSLPAVRARRPEIELCDPLCLEHTVTVPHLQLRSASRKSIFCAPERVSLKKSRGTGSQDASLNSILPCHWFPLYHSGSCVYHLLGIRDLESHLPSSALRYVASAGLAPTFCPWDMATSNGHCVVVHLAMSLA